MKPEVFDNRACTLGEGPLWHPLRKQLFWFDILERKLMTQSANGQQAWEFDETVSAAGWVDESVLLMASAIGLWRVTLDTGERELICPLEAENATTRSNDGRADPWGGFWIGTMGYNAEPGAGAIYRFFKGTLRKVVSDITVSNTICFAPDRSCVYYSDTRTRQIMKMPLDDEGWPQDEASVFVDTSEEMLNPDGAVVDAAGALWVAHWGAGQVASYDHNGKFVKAVALPAQQVTCPAFGGNDFSKMFVTSARVSLPEELIATSPEQGQTFVIEGLATGLAEPRVLL